MTRHPQVRRAVIAATVALAAVGALPTSALSDDRRPPAAVLRAHGDALQVGTRGSYCWSYSTGGGGGVGSCGDVAGYDWPRAARLNAPMGAAIRFHKPERAERLSLTAWRRVEEAGYPQGDAKRIRFVWRPTRRDGRIVAWDAVFTLWGSNRRYYIDAFGRWAEGDATYYFHVKTT